ncbi:D-tyrosyl-tRNA(Tyr) deacylase [Proteobacteria bacterium 005FR1]|nr:D-tyrosyl-tRNA(Tyr) deacylase [Proteobacteria bacterium 005FR1]
MRGLIQRVSEAEVRVEGESVGAIARGVLLLLGVEKEDDEARLDKLLHKIVNYRIFPDEEGRMNRSLLEIRGGILVVSQFTLAADTRKGLRPSFSSASPPPEAARLYDLFLKRLKNLESEGLQVGSGKFGADMQISLINDGPVTFLLEA